MPVTLANARNLTQDKLAQQVIDEFRSSSPFLDALVFDDNVSIGGGSTLKYVYNRITTYGKADFRAINTEYTSQQAETTPYTVELKPFGGSFEIDRVIQRDVRGVTNQLDLQLNQKIQGTIALYSDYFINGDTAVNALGFDGLSKALAGSSTEYIPTTAIDLSSSAAIDTNYKIFMDTLDQLLGELSGSASGILLNKKLFAIMKGIARRSNLFDGRGKNEFGQEILSYGGVPFMPMGDKSGTSQSIIPIEANGTTALYPIRIGLDGVHGITNDGTKIIDTWLPDFSTNSKNANAVKKGAVEMVGAMALKATKAAGVLRNIKIV